MGIPVIFVRTAGCPVKCSFCDTDWTKVNYDFQEPSDLIQELGRSRYAKYRRIVITGGEPMIQPDIYRFVEELKFEGYSIDLETSGYSDIQRGYFSHVVCSPKPNLKYKVPSGPIDELKYVVNEEFVKNINKYVPAAIRDQFNERIWLQPMDEGSLESIKANWKRCYELSMIDPRFRVGLQMHKFLGVQ